MVRSYRGDLFKPASDLRFMAFADRKRTLIAGGHKEARHILCRLLCSLNYLRTRNRIGEKKPFGLLLFLFLEQLLDGADACLLREHIARDNRKRFFRTPFNALWSVRFVFAQIAGVDRLGLRMEHHGAVVACFDAPTAAVAFVLVNHNGASFI